VKDVLSAIKGTIKKEGLTFKSIKYDKNCGCAMCPCSPGYVVRFEDGQEVDKMRTIDLTFTGPFKKKLKRAGYPVEDWE